MGRAAWRSLVPGEGFEPSRGFPQSILNRSWLPLHHPGGAQIVAATKTNAWMRTENACSILISPPAARLSAMAGSAHATLARV